MSNPGGVNLNIGPYFDDYNEDKKFVRVLFRPGRAVQARELTQAQTIQQKQIQRFADYFFRKGAIIDGCEQNLDIRLSFLKLQPTFGLTGNIAEVEVEEFNNKEIIGANTGVRAYVGLSTDIEGDDPKTLFLNYIGSGGIILTLNIVAPRLPFISVGNTVIFEDTGGTGVIDAFYTDPIDGKNRIFINNIEGDVSTGFANTVGSDGANVTIIVDSFLDKRTSKKFEENEKIFTFTDDISDSPNSAFANTASVQATSFTANVGLENEKTYNFGTKFTLSEGTIYLADHFLKNTTQTIILEKYKDDASYNVGVVPLKTFVDTVTDQTLLDNAAGTPNFQALGADRFKIDPVLTKIPLNEPSTENEFVRLATIENGVLTFRSKIDIDGKLETAIAVRTFEESGDYTLNDPKVIVREHLNQEENGGKFLQADGGNNDLLFVELDPFTAYVKGFRNEFLGKVGVSVAKGLDTELNEQTIVQLGYGGYITVNEMIGIWNSLDNVTVDLYDTPQKAVSGTQFLNTTVKGTKIGTARLKAFEYTSGSLGSATCVYTFYLYNVVMNSGRLFSNVRSIYYSLVGSPSSTAFADIILNVRGQAVLSETGIDRLIFELPFDGVKTIRDDTNNIETGFKFRREFQSISFNGEGKATVVSTDASETLNSGATNNLKNLNYYVVPSSNAVTGNLTGTVNVSGTIVSGVGTNFLNEVNVNDVIRINSTDRIIASITNTTHLVLTTSHPGATSNTYARVFPVGKAIDLTKNGKNGAITVELQTGSAAVNIDLKEDGITSSTGAGFIARVIATLNRSNAREIRKVLVPNEQVRINANTHPSKLVGPYSLGYGDGYKIKAIYQSSSFDIPAETSNTNVTSNYTFDNGQRDNSYEHATIRPKSGVRPTGQLLVVYDHFNHDTSQGVGYISVDSYPINDVEGSEDTINTAEIPIYRSRTGKVFNLRDCIDFRPIKVANTTATNPLDNGTAYIIPTGGLHIPVPDSDWSGDLIFYKGRKAKVVINTKGELVVNDGKPGYPISTPPPTLPDTIELAQLDIPVYPSQPKDVTVSLYKNKRYTMKDINRIEERVIKLEYYTSLNQLEQLAKESVETDELGLNRFKNGILVDPFVGHNVADVLSADYRAAMNREENYVTAYANNDNQVALRYNPTGSSNVRVLPGQKLMLNYSEVTFASQTFASQPINLVEDLVFTWTGDLEFIPASDNWLNTVRDRSKDFIVDLTGEADNWKALVDAWNTEVAPLNRHWVGLDTKTKSQTRTETTRSGRTETTKTIRRDTKTVTEGLQQQNASIEISTKAVNQAVDRVSDISVPQTMRSRDFIFEATSLKNNTRLFAFFDGENVTANCTQITLVGNTTTDDLFNLYTTNGILRTDNTKYRRLTPGIMTTRDYRVVGIFRVPANKFLTGQREFKLTDDSQNREDFETTYAKESIYAQGLTVTKSQDILNTRPFKVNFEDPKQVQTVQKRTTTSSKDTVLKTTIRQLPPPRDPIAQSFFVDPKSRPDGIFITSIDLFFRAKSTNPNLGVTVEIREMFNGFPTPKIVGGETARVLSRNIVVSENARSATRFTFKNPIYLAPGTNYAFAVKPDGSSPDFTVWTAQLGDFDITDASVKARIDKQTAPGVLFTSSNDVTWSVRQNQDLKFVIRCARFTTSGIAIIQNISDSDDVENIDYSSMIPNIEQLVLSKTNISYTVRQINTAYTLQNPKAIDILEQIVEPSTRRIASNAQELSRKLKSLTFTARLTTNNVDISPYIDLQRMNVALSRNIINNNIQTQLSGSVTYTSGSNVVSGVATSFSTALTEGEYIQLGTEYRQIADISNNTHLTLVTSPTSSASDATVFYRKEENPTGPYSSATRYITRRVTLNDGFEASDLVVYARVNRQPGTDIKVYYKILNQNDPEDFDDKFYEEMSLDGFPIVTQNPDEYTEEKYIVPASKKTGGSEILTGTISFTSGSTDVIGTDTRFFDQIRIGDNIAIGVSKIKKTVTNVTNSTFLVVDSAFSTTSSGEEIFKALNNELEYITPDGKSYSGFKYFSIKIVFLSTNAAVVPKVKGLRATALA